MTRLVTAIMAAALAPAKVETGGVRIHVRIRASDYAYEVTNVAAQPITSFDIRQGGAYLFRAPDGWSFEAEGGLFRAWTTDRRLALRPSQTGTFSMRVTSNGAVLGEVPVKIGLESGDEVALANVWGIVPEPRAAVALVPLVIAGLVLAHTLLLACRDRRAAGGAVSDA